MVERLSLIRVPFGLGAARRGTEAGPDSIVRSGLKRQIHRLGIEVTEEAVLHGSPRTNMDRASKVKNADSVAEIAIDLASEVSASVAAGAFPLVLGGDHSISIGSISGLSRHYNKLGLIWMDAHPDCNTEDTTPSGNLHGIPVAAAIGRSRFNIASIPGAGPFVCGGHTVIIGARDIDPGEKELIRSEGITCFTMHDIDRHGIGRIVELALSIAGNGTGGIHLSLDMDVLDPLEAPGVGTPVPGGLSYREAHFAMELLSASGGITSMDFVEVNPFMDIGHRTSRLAVELIASLLGKTIL